LSEITWNDDPVADGSKRVGRPIMPKSKALLLTLRKLASTCEYDAIAMQFDVSRSTVHRTVHRMLDILLASYQHLVHLPQTEYECSEASSQFCRLTDTELQGIIGSLDGTHIRWEPVEYMANDREYYNRKKYRSVVAIATCDSLLRFNFLSVGFPGSTHDSPAEQATSLRSQLARCPDGYFVIADSAFSISTRVLTPFRVYGRLSRPQKAYNYHLSTARVTIERAFGLLKGRWRSLRHLKCDLVNVPRFVTVAALLHNLCVSNGDICNEEFYDELELEENSQSYQQSAQFNHNIPHPANVQVLPLRNANVPHGQAARDYLVNNVFT